MTASAIHPAPTPLRRPFPTAAKASLAVTVSGMPVTELPLTTRAEPSGDGPRPLRESDRLDRRLAEARLAPRHARELGRALARRHGQQTAQGAEPAGPTPVMRRWHEAMRNLVEKGLVDADECEALAARFGPEPRRALDTLLARLDEGRGRRLSDFAPDEVFVRRRASRLDGPFREESGDPAEDLAALAAPLRRAGLHELAEQLLASYALETDDYDVFGLIDFFECLRACEDALRDGREVLEPWLASPDEELRTLILLTGGVASGKSTLAKSLVRNLAAPRVEADLVRAAVLEPVREAAGPLAALDRAWSGSFREDGYAALLQRCEAVLRSGRNCIVDACTPTAKARAKAAAAAERHGAELIVCTCLTSPARSAERLRSRDERDGVEPGTWEEIANRLWARYEPIGDGEPGRHVYLRTDSSHADGVAAVRASLDPAQQPKRRLRALPRGRLPRAVTFDCWNTLIREADWHRAHALRVAAIGAAVLEEGEARETDAIAAAFDRAWLRHMRCWREGVHSGAREVARWSLEYLGLPLPEAVVEELTEKFQTGSHSGNVVALEGARETLERLDAAGIPLALVCDTGLTPGRVVRRHLDALGLLAPLQAQLFSDEIGVPKPDARIFRAALGALGADPDRSVHVGDLRRTDIAGARALGMGSIRLCQAHDDDTSLPEADAVAAHHGDLPELLGLD